jgi:hypothetical protein
MTRLHTVLAVLAVTASLAPAALAAPRVSAEDEARRVTVAFFRSINARRYEQTCRLLSRAYYKKYRIPSKRYCVAGLRISFMWSQEIEFRIGGIEADRDRAVVNSTADGAAGRVILIRERGVFKVLQLDSA